MYHNVRRYRPRVREEEGNREGEGSFSESSSLPRDMRSARLRIVTAFHTPVTHACTRTSERAHKGPYTPTRLIFNPLDSVNACGRPLPFSSSSAPPHDVDSRPRFRVIGIRLLESCAPLYPPPPPPTSLSLPAGIRIIAHVSLETWIMLP